MRTLANALSRPAHIKLKYNKQAHDKQCVYLITHDVHLVQHAIVVDELLQTARHGHLHQHSHTSTSS